VLGLSILVGQGTTETSWRGLLLVLGVLAASIALIAGAAIALIARNYMSAGQRTLKPNADATSE
jgi:hypothetical protein